MWEPQFHIKTSSLIFWELPSWVSPRVHSLKKREPHHTGWYHQHVSSFFEKERNIPHWLLPSSSCVLALCHYLFDFFLRLKMFILCSLQHDNCNRNNSYHLVDILSTDCSGMQRSMEPFLQLSPLHSFCKFWCITKLSLMVLILVQSVCTSSGAQYKTLQGTLISKSLHSDRSFGSSSSLQSLPRQFFCQTSRFWMFMLNASIVLLLNWHLLFFACYFVFQLIGQRGTSSQMDTKPTHNKMLWLGILCHMVVAAYTKV